MPVRLIRVPRQAPPGNETPATVVDATEAGVVPHPRGWALGDAVLLRKLDLTDENGKVKFILHMARKDVWYRIRGVNEEERRLLLTAQSGYEFDSRIDSTLPANYIMAVLPEGTLEPPADLLNFVARVLPTVHSSALKAAPFPHGHTV